ncbi:CI transcriptional regulator [Klebsiella phage ST974-OXA48phi18.2]|nr:CI transcriptional regulator [Klebsiella phage ST974-OXA48phi18.2]
MTVKGGLMRIGIAFPASVFIIAVAFLAWFILGGYATPGT